MPTVPEAGEYMAAVESEAQKKKLTPEHVLMTAADMHSRGQLVQGGGSYKSPGADLKLPFPGGGRGARPSGAKGKRR